MDIHSFLTSGIFEGVHSVFWGFPGDSVVKNLLQCRRLRFDPWVRKKDPSEKEMATHSSILAWDIPWTEKPAMEKQRKGNSFQYSCLGYPMDRETYSPWSRKESGMTAIKQ